MTESDPKAKAREAAHSAARKEAEAGSLGTRITDAALDAYEAALSAPDGATRLVRIAVAEDAKGDIVARECEGWPSEAYLWDHLVNIHYPHRLAIVTARIPVREVPVVAGAVEEAG